MSFSQTRTKANYQVRSTTHPRYDRAVTLILNQNQAIEVANLCEEARSQKKECSFFVESKDPSGALENWFFIWKLWSPDTRLILAHPAHPEWVVTCALNMDHHQQVIDALTQGKSVDLNRLSPLARVTNCHVQLEVTP